MDMNIFVHVTWIAYLILDARQPIHTHISLMQKTNSSSTFENKTSLYCEILCMFRFSVTNLKLYRAQGFFCEVIPTCSVVKVLHLSNILFDFKYICYLLRFNIINRSNI